MEIQDTISKKILRKYRTLSKKSLTIKLTFSLDITDQGTFIQYIQVV